MQRRSRETTAGRPVPKGGWLRACPWADRVFLTASSSAYTHWSLSAVRIKKAFASIKLQRGETHNRKIKKNELNAAADSLSRHNPEGMRLLFS